MSNKKKSLISDKYWDKLKEEKDRQVAERGFYRKANWSDEFKKGAEVTVPEIDSEGLYPIE